MRYAISDPHGEYTLFMRMLDKIRFSASDELYLGGDMIHKGKDSLRLLETVLSTPSVYPIIGNHEYNLIKGYDALLRESPTDFDSALNRLRIDFYPHERELLTWELLDRLCELPAYIEREDFILVHSGLPLDDDGYPLPLGEADTEQLVHDRRFMHPSVVQRGERCVLFGHTESSAVAGVSRILAYRRDRSRPARTLLDYHKVHLDTGVFSSGTLGCLCLDTLECFYVHS